MGSPTVLCEGNNNALPNQTWTTKLPEIWDSLTFMDKCDTTGRPVQLDWHIFSGHTPLLMKRQIQTCFGCTETESCSCLFFNDIEYKKPGKVQQCRTRTKRLPNMQSNSSWVIGVCVDLDEQECGAVRARTNLKKPVIVEYQNFQKSIS